MALTDPQSVTIGATTHSLPRTGSGENSSRYTSADSTVQLIASSQLGKRVRRVYRVNHTKMAPDPLFPAQNVPASMSVLLTVDVPKTGYTLAEMKQVVDGLLGNLQASSGANITKLLGGEN